MTPALPASLPASPSRVLAVDLARALAVLLMIQGHSLNVLLAPERQANLGLDIWLFIRGLTSCLFFFLSGFAFTVATARRWDSFSAPSARFSRRLRRFGVFLLLGYALHFPVRHLRDLRSLDETGWRSFLQVDVLQTIALSLIGLQLLVLVARTPRRFLWLALASGAGIVLLTPLVWGVPWASFLPLPLASYLSAATGSAFPLFPWAGYLLVGAALGGCYVARKESPAALSFSRYLLRVGFLAFTLGFVFEGLPLQLYPGLDFWRTSPNLFLIRLGCVLMLLAGVFAAARLFTRLPRVVSALAEESLSIYLVHVCVLYGSVWNQGLAQRIGPRLGWPETLGWIAALLLSMSLLALSWNWAKRRQPPASRVLRATFALVLAYLLL